MGSGVPGSGGPESLMECVGEALGHMKPPDPLARGISGPLGRGRIALLGEMLLALHALRQRATSSANGSLHLRLKGSGCSTIASLGLVKFPEKLTCNQRWIFQRGSWCLHGET